jgi:hypothetical protein
MREANFGGYHIRKWFTCVEDTLAIFAFATRGRLHARLGGLAASAIEGNDGLR